MIDGADIFWQHFYKSAGLLLGGILPVMLGFLTFMLLMFRFQQRHEERMQDARLRTEAERYGHTLRHTA